MADAIAPAGTTPPAGQDTTTQTPAVAPAPAAPAAAAPAAPAAPPKPADPGWLNARLAEKEKATEAKLLKELGVSDLSAAKTVLSEAAARAEAAKTAEQKQAELAAKVTAAERAQSLLTEQAMRMLGVLSDKHQELVKSLAGEDPLSQLQMIQKLTDSGVLTFDDEPAAPAANPNGTAPPPTAPGGTSPAAPPSPRAEYERAKQTNPFVAAAYGLRHADEVYKVRP